MRTTARGISTVNAYLLVLAIACVVILLDSLDGRWILHDMDDNLREAQIRLLLTRNSWFDLSIPAISMPQPYISPWSRLVDLPYYLLAKGFGYFLGASRGFALAMNVWPPAMLLIFCALLVRSVKIISAHAARLPDATALAFSACLSSFAFLEYVPGRVDHHNVQLLLMLTFITGIASWKRQSAIVAGVAGAFSLLTGFECLPLVFVGLSLCLVCWFANLAGSRQVLLGASSSMLICLPLGSLVLQGPQQMLAFAPDVISAPYLIAICGICLAAVLASFYVPEDAAFSRKATFFAPVASLFVVITVLRYPEILSGPYAIVDELSRRFWLDRTHQEQNALEYFRESNVTMIATMAIWCLVIVMAAPLAWRSFRAGEMPYAIAFVMATASLMLTLSSIRHVRFTSALVPLILPGALEYLKSQTALPEGGKTAVRLVFAPALLILAIATFMFWRLPQPSVVDAIELMDSDDCAGANFNVLSSYAPARILAPPGLALAIFKSAPEGISISGLLFHRSSPGLNRTYTFFTSPDAAARRDAAEPYQYVAVCGYPAMPHPETAPIYTALAAGLPLPGLERIVHDQKSGFQLFRINHSGL